MTEPRRNRSGRENEERANRLTLGLIGALLLLTLVVVLVASMNPPGARAPQGSLDNGAAVVSTPAPSPVATVAVEPPTATATPVPAEKPEPKPAPAKPAKTAPKPAKTLPDLMSHLPSGSRQLIVIKGRRIGSNSGTLELYNKNAGHWKRVMSVRANFGKNGLVDGKKRKQGHLQTPTGLWSIGSFVFGLHKSAPSNTRMPYRAITKNSWWSSREGSTYNKWVESSGWGSGEHLIDADPQYEYAFNSGYNSRPNERVFGRGTAIFIHCFEPPGNALGKYTHGCIAISPDNMVRLFKRLDPDRKPYCAIGTLKKGSSTSIWAY